MLIHTRSLSLSLFLLISIFLQIKSIQDLQCEIRIYNTRNVCEADGLWVMPISGYSSFDHYGVTYGSMEALPPSIQVIAIIIFYSKDFFLRNRTIKLAEEIISLVAEKKIRAFKVSLRITVH